MAMIKKLKVLFCTAFVTAMVAQAQSNFVGGPLYSEFDLTLTPGKRVEAAGPFYYSQRVDDEHQIATPPLFSWTRNEDLEYLQWDFVYPVLNYRSYGREYRLQFFQLLNWTGGNSQEEKMTRRITAFPIYFQQRNPQNPTNDYTAFLPFYGHLRNRLFRDDIKFVLFPVYSETRKKDVITDNYLYPIFHQRHGDNLTGWQVWPFVGEQHKGVTFRTNQVDELETIGGHERSFVAWPFYLRNTEGIGTTNVSESLTVLPFYSQTRSPLRDSTSYGWPLGYTVIDDRAQKYHERQYLGPLIDFADGDGKTTSRVFPFYSHARNATLESHWYFWPVYKVNRLHADPLERSRMRILFFLYSNTLEINTENGDYARRVDCWPFFTSRREMDGRSRFQLFALFEPIYPNNKTLPREYGQVYSLYTSEHNPTNGASSQSVLWNTIRREETPQTKRVSILFGLVEYQSSTNSVSWRMLYGPARKRSPNSALLKP